MGWQEEREEKQKWLESLKEGDEVTVNTHSWYVSTPSIKKVTGFTKLCIRVGDTLYYKDGGRERTTSYTTCYITPVTPEVIEKIKRKKLLDFFNSNSFSETLKELTTEQLETLKKTILEMESANNEAKAKAELTGTTTES